ncbi:MAG: hypothetical protein ACFFC7_31515 [Candidatus Hermodarchaeota archaeon]
MILSVLLGLLLYRTDPSERTILRISLIVFIISFLSTFVGIAIRIPYIGEYFYFLPLSYPLGLFFEVSPLLIFPPIQIWSIWFLTPEFLITVPYQFEPIYNIILNTGYGILFFLINYFLTICIITVQVYFRRAG